MEIYVDVPKDVLRSIRDLVEEGEYETPQSFIETALEEQVDRSQRERSEAKSLSEALGELEHESPDGGPSEGDSVRANGPSNQSVDTSDPSGWCEILQQRSYDSVPRVPPPDGSLLDDGPLWGQYNRIFPVKLVVRGVANVYLDDGTGEGGWTRRSPVGNRVTDTARRQGVDLKVQDERQGRQQGEKLSTGLPVGDDADRSKDRFETHFLGNAERDGDLTGASPHLRFLNFRQRDGKTEVGITEAGCDFAELTNPLLDEGLDAEASLSAEERDFYIEHVRDACPDEYDAMKLVAKAISEGDDRPSKLTNRVAYLDTSWSSSQAQTIRSGLTSRMFELGLVDRKRVSQRGIAYELTPEGDALLTGSTTNQTDN